MKQRQRTLNTADDRFRRFATEPCGLARRLCRELSHDAAELQQAAIRWCDWVSSLQPIPDMEDAESTYQLLTAASSGSPVFQSWVSLARGERRNPERDAGSEYDGILLSALLSLWPARHQPELYQGRLCAWAQAFVLADEHDERRARAPLSVAFSLCSFPEVAYALVQRAPSTRRAAPVQKDPALALASLALFRRLQCCEPHELDGEALARPSAAQYLGRESLRQLLRELLARGKAVPESLWPEIDRILGGERDEAWYQALALLTGYLPRQADAVELMANALQSDPDPAEELERMSGVIAGVGSPFRGHGWKRQELGRKLLPIARALLARRVWPTSTWLDCLRPCDDESALQGAEERMERQYDRVKRVLGEALLERASDPEESRERRIRAIGAIGRLAPAGDTNLLRALGRFYDDFALRRAAKDAQREARERARAGHIDGELCVMDAWEHFAGSAAEQESLQRR
jgi:hypothetical protein